MLQGTLYYDYSDPVSFLMELCVRELEEEGLLTAERHPLEMCPPPRPPIDPTSGWWVARLEGVRGLMADHAFAQPSFIPWTRKAHELVLLARERGCFAEVHEAIFRSHLIDGTDIGRVDVLVELGSALGLDLSEAKAVLDVDRHTATVEELRAEAIAAGIHQPGTLCIAGENLEGPLQIRDLRSRTCGSQNQEPSNTAEQRAD